MQRLPKSGLAKPHDGSPGDTDPAWRTIGEDAPVGGDQKMAQAAWVADGAASVEVAAECISCRKSRPRGRWRAR